MIIIPISLLQKDLLIVIIVIIVIITIIIIIIIVLLRQLGAVWLQSWPTIPRSKSRFVASIKFFTILLVSMLLIYHLYSL